MRTPNPLQSFKNWLQSISPTALERVRVGSIACLALLYPVSRSLTLIFHVSGFKFWVLIAGYVVFTAYLFFASSGETDRRRMERDALWILGSAKAYAEYRQRQAEWEKTWAEVGGEEAEEARGPRVPQWHEILGVPPTATKQEARKAFIKMMKKCHPDLNKDSDGTKAKELNEFWDVVCSQQGWT